MAQSNELDSDSEGNLDVDEPLDLLEEDGKLKEIENPKEPAPQPSFLRKKKQRLPKIIPTVLGAEDKKFMLFLNFPNLCSLFQTNTISPRKS